MYANRKQDGRIKIRQNSGFRPLSRENRHIMTSISTAMNSCTSQTTTAKHIKQNSDKEV